MDKETEAFRFTFGRLATALGDNSFRKYDLKREAYFGGFSLSVFEPISMGLGYHFEAYNNAPSNLLPDIRKISKDLWKSPVFTNNSGSGVRASQRVRTNIPLGRRMFKP